MARSGGRLTPKEEQFIESVVKKKLSYVAAFRLSYPPRNGPRSASGERVQAKRIANRPVVQQAMKQLREELLASDPVRLRQLALGTLAKILSNRLDARFRRGAIVLKEREAARVELETYRALTDRLTALDAAELALERRAASCSARRNAITEPQEAAIPLGVDERPGDRQRPSAPEDTEGAARQLAKIREVVMERRRASQSEDARGRALPKQPSRVHDPQHVAHNGPSADHESHAVRKPGCFGKPVWMRAPGVG